MHRTRAELQDWLCAYLTGELRLSPGTLDPAEPLSTYGLDSVAAVVVLTDVEDHVGFEIDPNALWEFPTVESFAQLLADLCADRTGLNTGRTADPALTSKG